MTYSTLMVQLQLGSPQAGLLQIAGDLAERLDAGVIGVVACRPIDISCGDGFTTGGVIQIDYEEIEKETVEAKAEFYAALGSRVKLLGWRASVSLDPVCDFVARQARSADLLIAGVMPTSFLDQTRVMNISDLVMQAGRPVLIVPEKQASLKLDRVLVAWRDTREARRAISDALPMLKKAAEVMVVELVSPDDLADAQVPVDEVVAWLGRHGIKAIAAVATSKGDDADELSRCALAYEADVIVAGAYGHSRLREWALGGVTRDLLLGATHCSLVSH